MSKLVKETQIELKEKIVAAVNSAVANGELPQADMPDFIIEKPQDKKNGDFSSNIAMAGARAYKKAPRMIAESIVSNLDLEGTLFEKAEIAGPGFINFFLSDEYYAKILKDVVESGEDYGKSDYGEGKKILVEFVSANPTGPMHIGNARGGAIGDCLASVLQYAGYDVKREFYINDAGNQIEKFATSLEVRYLQA
ncbi:MAG: arginine--tRNA ligase, partial [Eubacterium sp.]|nr:arginine--tRNA ligase [Eubacterium sp.]